MGAGANPFNPVFIIGPGRSGTTLLYKLLSLHPEIGYVSNYDTRLPCWIPAALVSRFVANSCQLKRWSWFAGSGNAYVTERSWLKKWVPTPVEGEILYTRNGVSLCETDSASSSKVVRLLRQEFIRLQTRQNSRALLLKRTANNRRIPTLAAAFPEARYIFLIRDGRAVALSLTKVHWWNDHQVWWAQNKTPREIACDGTDMLAIAARNWIEELRAIRTGLNGIREENVQHIRYEELLKQPLHQLNHLLEFIGVKPSVAYDEAIRRLGISQKPEAWRNWSPQDLGTVMRIQHEWLQNLNYV